jgi:hypothetical protein
MLPSKYWVSKHNLLIPTFSLQAVFIEKLLKGQEVKRELHTGVMEEEDLANEKRQEKDVGRADIRWFAIYYGRSIQRLLLALRGYVHFRIVLEKCKLYLV